MDLDKVLRKLYAERERMSEIIASLEQLRNSAAAADKAGKKPAKKAVRKAKKPEK